MELTVCLEFPNTVFELSFEISFFFFFKSSQEIEDAYLDVNSIGELDGSNPGVILPSVECPLSEEDMARLRDTVNVTRPSQSHGRDIYLDVLNFVLTHRS